MYQQWLTNDDKGDGREWGGRGRGRGRGRRERGERGEGERGGEGEREGEREGRGSKEYTSIRPSPLARDNEEESGATTPKPSTSTASSLTCTIACAWPPCGVVTTAPRVRWCIPLWRVYPFSCMSLRKVIE